MQKGDVSFILRDVEQVKLNPESRCGTAPAEPLTMCSTQGQGFRSGVEGLCFSTKLL